MPHVFSDSNNKRVVREKWNTPLLRHLHSKYGYSYRYFGLPGPDIIDIKLWRDMIKEVVAFELPVEGGKSAERTNINALRKNLELTGIPNTTYYGSFEEVVLLGMDYDGLEYSQNNVITLYNLDFCGEIGSKVMSFNGDRLYRFEALRQIIRNQRECFNRFHGPSCFIILLTVRNQMDARLLRERLTACQTLWADFIRKCEEINPITGAERFVIGSHAWAIKTVIHFIFNQSLSGNNISALFFPLVKYEGIKAKVNGGRTIPSPMLHLMLFCKLEPERGVAGVTIPKNPLLTKSLTVSGSDLVSAPEPGEESNILLSSVEFYETLRSEILG